MYPWSFGFPPSFDSQAGGKWMKSPIHKQLAIALSVMDDWTLGGLMKGLLDWKVSRRFELQIIWAAGLENAAKPKWSSFRKSTQSNHRLNFLRQAYTACKVCGNTSLHSHMWKEYCLFAKDHPGLADNKTRYYNDLSFPLNI